MDNIEIKEKMVKNEMINEIIKYSKHDYSRKELEAKNFSVLKFMYYDVLSPILEGYKIAS